MVHQHVGVGLMISFIIAAVSTLIAAVLHSLYNEPGQAWACFWAAVPMLVAAVAAGVWVDHLIDLRNRAEIVSQRMR